MRERGKILGNLEDLYREAYERASRREDQEAMATLDFGFQRDQLMLEAVLDLRDLLAELVKGPDRDKKPPSLLEKAQAVRRLARIR